MQSDDPDIPYDDDLNMDTDMEHTIGTGQCTGVDRLVLNCLQAALALV